MPTVSFGLFEKGALEESKMKYEFLHSSDSMTVDPKHWNYISGTKYFLFIDAYVMYETKRVLLDDNKSY